ncbi:MAG: hypothetical protein U0Y82_11790 [Thermoleophilia bacterium]
MQPIHRKVLAVIVGVAAILGVSALSLTASLGPDQKPAKALTNGATTQPAISPAKAHAKMLKARALLAKQKAQRERVRNTPRRTVTVVRTLPTVTVSRSSGGGSSAQPTASAPTTQAAPAATTSRRHDEGEHSNRHEESDHGNGSQTAAASQGAGQSSHGQDD